MGTPADADSTTVLPIMPAPAELADGRYRIERLIGRGGMADVYLARDQQLGRPVAVKLLRPELARDPAFAARFKHEAHAAAALNHPHVVAVYDWGSDASTSFIVMELVPGPDLRDLLRQRVVLPEFEALGVAAQIADALDAAHERGLVHCDVKPLNVLFNDRGLAKVADFGIACAVDGSPLDERAVMGSIRYMAPEQVRGGSIDPRTDLYGLGATLYEMLTGRPPYDGDSAAAIALQHVEAPVPSPRALRPTVSPATDALVRRALAKDPDERFASAAEMLRAIDAARAALFPGLNATRMLPRAVGWVGDRGRRSRPTGDLGGALRRRLAGAVGQVARLGTAGSWTARTPGPRIAPRMALATGVVAFGMVGAGLLASQTRSGLPAGDPGEAVLASVARATNVRVGGAASCEFKLGFKQLHDRIPEVVGDCIEDEHPDPSTGNVVQRTTRGLLVWRKTSDQRTAFTDGYRTWIDGPDGVQQRLNADRFPWEPPAS